MQTQRDISQMNEKNNEEKNIKYLIGWGPKVNLVWSEKEQKTSRV